MDTGYNLSLQSFETENAYNKNVNLLSIVGVSEYQVFNTLQKPTLKCIVILGIQL